MQRDAPLLRPGVARAFARRRLEIHGRAAQVEPTKPMLKAPATTSNRLKLKYDSLLSNFALIFNMRRYATELREEGSSMDYFNEVTGENGTQAGAYTRPLFGST